MPRLHDMSGQRFGRLTALRHDGEKWECVCDCGGTAKCLPFNLKRGNSKSCGCLKRELHTRHGGAGTTEYSIWCAMHRRCEDPKNPGFKDYGARGITVCERWSDFNAFLEDMGKRPLDHEIDRERNNEGYCKENCRWVTREENNRNKRNNVMIRWRGEDLPLVVWAERLNMNYWTLSNRIHRGWTVERALTQPVR